MNLIKMSLILYPSVPGGPRDEHPYTWSERLKWVHRQIEKELKGLDPNWVYLL